MVSVPYGGPRSETVRFKNNDSFTLNNNNFLFLNDESLILFAIET